MASQRLPAWLYESLPYIYVAVGLASLMFAGGILASLCGVLLVSAGAVIIRMRVVYRRAHRKPAALAPAGVAAAGGPVVDAAEGSAHLIQLVWRPKYECGDPVIDAQHRHLFGMGNELVNALIVNRNRFDLELLLDEFFGHVARHFETEESIAEQECHGDLEAHREVHKDLLCRAHDLLRRFQGGERIHGEIVTFITTDVIVKHIVSEDLALLGTKA